MQGNAPKSYIWVVGTFLLAHLNANPEDAGKILDKSKTIKGSLDEMRKEAQKQSSGGCAVLADEEGFSVVLEYYGIEVRTSRPPVATPAAILAASAPAQEAKKQAVSFDVRLDDLL
jgi:hypothetical protein